MLRSRKTSIIVALLLVIGGVGAWVFEAAHNQSESGDSQSANHSNDSVDGEEAGSTATDPMNRGKRSDASAPGEIKTSSSDDLHGDDQAKGDAALDSDTNSEEKSPDASGAEKENESGQSADNKDKESEQSLDYSEIGEAWRPMASFDLDGKLEDQRVSIEITLGAALEVRSPRSTQRFESVFNHESYPWLGFPGYSPKKSGWLDEEYESRDFRLYFEGLSFELVIRYLPKDAPSNQVLSTSVDLTMTYDLLTIRNSPRFLVRSLIPSPIWVEDSPGAKILGIALRAKPAIRSKPVVAASIEWRQNAEWPYRKLAMQDEEANEYPTAEAVEVLPAPGSAYFDLGDFLVVIEEKAPIETRDVELTIPWELPANAAIDLLVFPLDPELAKEAASRPLEPFYKLENWKENDYRAQWDFLLTPMANRRLVPADHKLLIPLGKKQGRIHARLDQGWPLFLLPLSIANVYGNYAPEFCFADLTKLAMHETKKDRYEGSLKLRSLLILKTTHTYHGLACAAGTGNKGQRVEIDAGALEVSLRSQKHKPSTPTREEWESTKLTESSTQILFLPHGKVKSLHLRLRTPLGQYFGGKDQTASLSVEDLELGRVTLELDAKKPPAGIRKRVANDCLFVDWSPAIGISMIQTKVIGEESIYNLISFAAKIADEEEANWFGIYGISDDLIELPQERPDKEPAADPLPTHPFHDEKRFVYLDSDVLIPAHREAKDVQQILFVHPYHFDPLVVGWRRVDADETIEGSKDHIMRSKIYNLTIDTKELEVVIDQKAE